MNRRNFIKKTLVSLPLLAIWHELFCIPENSLPQQGNGKKIIVIGAGISGLAAAKKLKENGFEVLVFESQDKVGGRLRTNRSTGIAFDEGASWIHGTQKNPLTELAKEAGMKTVFTDDESIVSYDIGGKKRTETAYFKTEKEFLNVLASLSKSGKPSESFETVFKRLHPKRASDRLWQFLLSTYVTFDCGDLDKLSSLYYDEGKNFGGQEVMATNGYDSIPTFLSKGIDIRLEQRVTQIDYTKDSVKVTHNNIVTEADYVLVTVPLGVLKANTIKFLPALPVSKQIAIQKIGMNCVNKFLLIWEKPFWDDVTYISYTPTKKDKFNYFVNVNKLSPNSNALMTFAYADYARMTESMTDDVVTAEIMKHLRDIYGPNIPNPQKMLRTKWQSNPNSFGAYSYTAVGTEMSHYDDLAEEIKDKVFFAGEHTEADYFSTAHGAYLSGLREADKIMNL